MDRQSAERAVGLEARELVGKIAPICGMSLIVASAYGSERPLHVALLGLAILVVQVSVTPLERLTGVSPLVGAAFRFVPSGALLVLMQSLGGPDAIVWAVTLLLICGLPIFQSSREAIPTFFYLGATVPLGLWFAGAHWISIVDKTLIVAAVSVFEFAYVYWSQWNIDRLLRAQEDLRAASAAKDQFLATMSHELRTPLNGIVGLAQLLEAEELSDEQRGYVATLTSSTRHLNRIIDDILDFSKLRAGRMELYPEWVELPELLDQLLAVQAPAAAARDVKLEVRFDEDLPCRAKVDRTRLAQVLFNLVGNAIKFSPRGRVDVSVRLDEDGALRFEVRDTGPGIAEEQVERLFQPFVQSDQGTTRKFGGTGLGLAICKQLMALMDGEIGVETKLGLGSLFWFRFRPETDGPLPGSTSVSLRLAQVVGGSATKPGVPPRAPAPKVEPVEPAGSEVAAVEPAAVEPAGSEPERGATSGAAAATVPACVDEPQPSPRRRTDPRSADLRILVVDDHPVNRMVAAKVVKKFGYAADMVEDGAQAVDRAGRARYDAILMDCEMPVMDGFEATRQIRRMAGPQGVVPIIALTAHALEGARERCLDAGMNDYLTKPLNAPVLRDTLQRLVCDSRPCDVA